MSLDDQDQYWTGKRMTLVSRISRSHSRKCLVWSCDLYDPVVHPLDEPDHGTHYKNTENFLIKNSDIFHLSSQNIDYGCSLELPWQGGSNEYPQSMFLSEIRKTRKGFLEKKKPNVPPPRPQYRRVVILVCNTSSRPVLHLYQASSKYSVGYSCYRAETRNQIQTQEREITPKVKKKPKLSFLYVTCRLVLFFITTKYHQNSS